MTRLQGEGARRLRRLPALRAARLHHLGAGRRPGCYRWRNIRRRLHAGRDEQGAGLAEPRLLADAAPLAHRADHRHRRRTSSASTRSRCASATTSRPSEMPYETPNGCVYDSGDYARCLDIALDLIGYDSIEERAGRGRVARQAARRRHRLDARLGHEQLRPVAAVNPELQFSGQQRGRRRSSSTSSARSSSRSAPSPQGQGHETTAAQVVARHPRLLARRRARARRATTRTGTRTPASPARTRASSPSPGSAPSRARPTMLARRDEHARRRASFGGAPDEAIELADGLRADQGQPARRRCRSWRSARSSNANNAGLPADLDADAQLPLRLPAAVRGAGQGEEVRQPDADLRDADPRLRRRDRPGDGRRTRSSTTRPSTTAACGSTRRSSRARCMGATAHALGAAMHEAFAYDEDGNLLTPNFYDYHVPARARHAAAQDRLRSSRRRRSRRSARRAWARAAAPASTPSAPRSRTRSCRAGGAIVYDSCNPYHRVWEMLQRPGGDPRAIVEVVVAVKVEGRRSSTAPREVVWGVLNDPAQMAKTDARRRELRDRTTTATGRRR